MSKTLRRPMFRGGRVDSRGTGITSGLDDSGYADGGRVGFQVGGSYPSFRSPISTSRTFGVEPGYNLLDKFKSLIPDTRSIRQRREDEARLGLDIKGAIELGNTEPEKDTTPPPPPSGSNIPRELTEEEQLIKQTQLYQKLLGGDEAKSQAVFDALLAASPAFFKGRNLREAAPEVLTAINKSGAFDKPKDIRQAAAQLSIQRAMLRDKAVAEERSRLAIYGAKSQKDIFDILEKQPGGLTSFGGNLEKAVAAGRVVDQKLYKDNLGKLIKAEQDKKTGKFSFIEID
jgi:hypothetical protein